MARAENTEARPNPTDVRNIIPKFSDFAALRYPHLFPMSTLPDPSLQITEQAITDFCSGCDRLQQNNQCSVNDSNDQARYAERKWCGIATVGDQIGDMTSKGFKPR